MHKCSPLQYVRADLVAVSDPRFLIEREAAAEAGALDFASSINHAAGPMALYPPFYPEKICGEVALSLNAQMGTTALRAENILITRGSSEGIDLSLRACLTPGVDAIVYPSPTFPMYEYWAKISGVRATKVALTGPNLDILPTEALVASGAKVAFICNPNSPTGIPFTKASLKEFISTFAGLVVVDEAYVDFCPAFSLADQIQEFPNLVVLRSFSKSWGLAGARLGCVIGAPELIGALRVLQGPFGIPGPAEDVLAKSLRETAPRTAYLNLIESERGRMISALEKSPGVSKVFPSRTNFILFKHTHGDAVHTKLLENGFFLNDCRSVGPGTLRLSLRSAEENDRLLHCISQLEIGT
jgi:histidinol-phosphate aminotransferase